MQLDCIIISVEVIMIVSVLLLNVHISSISILRLVYLDTRPALQCMYLLKFDTLILPKWHTMTLCIFCTVLVA